MPLQLFRHSLVAAAMLTVSFASLADVLPPLSPYTSLKIFGDSLSDSGNNAILLGTGGGVPTSNTYVPSGAPYASGTYSNGNVWVNAFAAAEGLPLAATPSLLPGGSNYAAGGARTNDASIYPPSATAQVNSFLAGVTTLPSTGLYVIAIGGNDVRDVTQAVALGSSPPSAVGPAALAYANAVGDMVDALQAKGAQHIVVWDAPDVGKTPALLSGFGGAFASLATSVATAFNGALAGRLAGEPGVIPFDVFGVVDAIVANPAAYGLTNVTDACGAVINACSSDLSTALFYDGIHPTAAGHAILASAMFSTVAAAVPEPATWLMLAAGVGLLVLRRRRA
jgi:phospholipase/lecithinase/hemolysin